jgi:ribosome biogenesis GTPase
MTVTGLEQLGYDEWVHKASTACVQDGFVLARVIEVNKSSYVVADGNHEMVAELSGKFLFSAELSTDYPTVGDWVSIQPLDSYTHSIIHCIVPRKTMLTRKEPGKRIDFQLIASNIDYGLIVQAADQPNIKLLQRYCAMLHQSSIQPVAVFNKIDLLNPEQSAELCLSCEKLTIESLCISTQTEGGIEGLASSLKAGKTYCLLGQSGVGKTSLLNSLLRADAFKVSPIRQKDGKGRHTTVRRHLTTLASGTLFIDTPGIRELGNFGIEEGIEQTFDQLAAYSQQCHFRDCTHTHEEGCALIAAVDNGEVEQADYNNYLKLRKESRFYEQSYQEKRSRDKAFGKLKKNYKKQTREE